MILALDVVDVDNAYDFGDRTLCGDQDQSDTDFHRQC
jgi:hypothetical protein